MKEEPTPNLPNKAALSKIEEKLKEAKLPALETTAPPPPKESAPEGLIAGGQATSQYFYDAEAIESQRAEFKWTLEQEKALIEAMRRCGNFDDLAKMVGRGKFAVQQKIVDMMREKELFNNARKALLR